MLTNSLERAAQIDMVAPVNEVFMINGTEMPELQAEKGDTLIESDTCTVTGLYSYVDGIIKKSVILTGVDTNITPARTPKRKTISPPSMHQVARAHKFQKCGDTASPTLRI